MPVMKSYFPQLTGLRAVAALMVFFHHYNPFVLKWDESFMYHFCNEMYVGVNLFFVLSGFLLALRYSKGFSYKSEFFKPYFVKRFARIFPLFILLTVITFVWQLYEGKGDWIALILNMTMLKGLFADYHFSILPQTWTITVEECFYIFLPFWCTRIRTTRKLFPPVILLFAVLGVLFLISYALGFPGGLVHGFSFVRIYTIWGHFFQFFCGVMAARMMMRRKFEKSKNITIIGSAVVFSSYSALVISGCYFPTEFAVAGVGGGLIASFPLSIGYGLIILGLTKEQTWLSRILSYKYVELAGKSSYAFYLLHLGFFAVCIAHFVPHIMLQLVFIALLSVVVYKYVEEPLRRFLIRMIL